MEGGIDINSKDEDGRTPLMDAVALGKINSATYLFERGASTNDVTIFGENLVSISRQSLNQQMISIVEGYFKK